MPFGHTYVNVHDEKCIRIGPNTTLRCKRKCAYNDSGVCFFTGEVEIGIKCKRFIREEDKPAPKQPEDYEDPSCSSGMRCWVTAYFFGKTQEEVVKKKEEYRKKYPNMGYSTYDSQHAALMQSGFWFGAIRRYSTCD